MFEIRYTPHFIRKFKKLPKDIQEKYAKKEDILKKDPFHQSLKAHKLYGNLKAYWSISIDYQYRVLFRFDGGKLVIVITIGSHNVYEEII